jgi:hypothetical protein
MKEWPIVMTCSFQYLGSTREWLATLPFYSLDQLKSREAAEIDGIRRGTFKISDDKRSNFPLS